MLKGKHQPPQGCVDGPSRRRRSSPYTSVRAEIALLGHREFPRSSRKRGNQLLSWRCIVQLVEVKDSAFCHLTFSLGKELQRYELRTDSGSSWFARPYAGSGGGIRTPDTRIMIPLLSPLSYPASCVTPRADACPGSLGSLRSPTTGSGLAPEHASENVSCTTTAPVSTRFRLVVPCVVGVGGVTRARRSLRDSSQERAPGPTERDIVAVAGGR